MKKLTFLLVTTLMVLALIGCGTTDTSSLDQNALVATAVKQTDDAQMQLTSVAKALATEEPTATPEPTQIPATAEPTASPQPTVIPPTATPSSPCLEMQFVTDVTIPDDTWVDPGDPFTKTWRIKNTGSCTWDSSYKVEFDYGAQMGAPASVSVPEKVNPGEDVDITVELEAPTDPGTYTGYFWIKSGTGISFGTFFVQVFVPIPELADFDGEILEISQYLIGSVDAAGNVDTTHAYAGDTADDDRIQAFFSFDISDIPSTATINAAYLMIPGNSIAGDPFGHLGDLRVYSGAIFPLGAGDYSTGEYEDIEYQSAAELTAPLMSTALNSEIQDSLAAGKIELQLYFYDTQSNDDGVADHVDITDIRLLIYYTP
jgi:hypothetical protein